VRVPPCSSSEAVVEGELGGCRDVLRLAMVTWWGLDVAVF
jgi:hypothetical protein